MKVPSLLFKVLSTAFLLIVFVGCTPNYVDGEYRVEFNAYDSLGYKEFITATVLDGQIVKLNIGGVDKNGVSKTQNAEYLTAMELATGTTPDTVYETLDGRYLLLAADKTSDATVDAVTGATVTSNNYQLLFEALKGAVVTGTTNTTINLPPES